MDGVRKILIKQALLEFRVTPSDPHEIINLYWGFDHELDIWVKAVQANGAKRRVCIQTHTNDAKLSWKEMRAFRGVLQFLKKGNKVDLESSDFEEQLVKIAVRTVGSAIIHRSAENVLYLFPGKSKMEKSKDTLFGIHLAKDTGSGSGQIAFHKLLLRGSTSNKTFYIVITSLYDTRQKTYTTATITALIGSLALLEEGDTCTLDTFLIVGKMLRQKLSFVNVDMTADNIYMGILPVVGAGAEAGATNYNYGLLAPAKCDDPRAQLQQQHHQQVKFGNEGSDAFGDLVLVKRLSEGAQAIVYEARRKDGSIVAAKVYRDHNGWLEAKSEIKTLLRIMGQPNLVKVIDFFEVPKPCVVMEYIAGKDLASNLKEYGALKTEDAYTVVKGLVSGLKVLHENGLVHRDLKSSNVMLKRSPLEVIIIDLGLSGTKQVGVNVARTENAKGTLVWMAPEMIMRAEWSDKIDIYALGIMIWEVLSGEIPYVNESPESVGGFINYVCVERKRPLLHSIKTRDVKLEKLMQICWSHDPEDRPITSHILNVLESSSDDFSSQPDKGTGLMPLVSPGLVTLVEGDEGTSSSSNTDSKIVMSKMMTINKAKETFAKYDTTASGTLDFEEFLIFAEALWAPYVIHAGEVARLFNTMVFEGEQEITFPQFLPLWVMINEQGLRNALKLCETTLTGEGSFSEVPTNITEARRFEQTFSEQGNQQLGSSLIS
mmetsp:Transcript_45337/g.72798  ORF Transcript_45337/g.72798 Transcript_45337/m.72798 type:complete len:715 (-) Transcript_45337:2287-4431(-)